MQSSKGNALQATGRARREAFSPFCGEDGREGIRGSFLGRVILIDEQELTWGRWEEETKEEEKVEGISRTSNARNSIKFP